MTLTIMRALCVIAKDGAKSNDDGDGSRDNAADGGQPGKGNRSSATLVDALDALFMEYWVNHAPTHESAELLRVLRRLLGDEDAESGACLPFAEAGCHASFYR